MDQQGVSLGGMLSSGFCRLPWHMYQVMPTLTYWFRNNETEPATLSQSPTTIGTPIELCSTVVIDSDVRGQLQVVDENKVPLHRLEEDFTVTTENEEEKLPPNEEEKLPLNELPRKLPPNELPKEDTNDTGEQSVPCETVSDKAQVSEKCHEVVCDGNLLECPPSTSGLNQRKGAPHKDHIGCIDSVVQEPHHILHDAVEKLGEYLNVLVTHVHHMASNNVKFLIETEVWHGKDRHRRLSLTKEQPVTDPSDHHRYPEAFDCRRILQHIRKRRNLRKYAALLDYHRSKDLKRQIDGILGRIPGKWSPRPTWDSLFDTLHKIKSFIEQAVAGLRRNNEDDLATKLDKGYENLEIIIAKAANAQQLSS